jgi:hypothetical protein
MATNKTDRTFKQLQDREVTDENKLVFEEQPADTLTVANQFIWAETIDSDPPTAVTAGIAQLRTLFALTEDTSVPDQQSWKSGLRDWIAPKFGTDYEIALFDGNDAEIFPTDSLSWLWDYKTGILTISGNAAPFSKPFKVTGHRYIGTKGIVGGGGAAGKLTPLNKQMASLVTSSDGDPATLSTVAVAPVTGGTVEVFISIKVSVGDAVKTEDCYFSTDAGLTALPLSGIIVGASLHWVGSVAGYELDGTELIDFVYVAP